MATEIKTPPSTAQSKARRSATVRLDELRIEKNVPLNVEESPNGFNFEGQTKRGRLYKLYINLSNMKDAEEALNYSGFQVLSLTPRSMAGRRRKSLPSRVELAQFAEQFGDQMEAGETAATVCEMLGRNHTNLMFSAALLNAANLIREGKTVSSAFALQVVVGKKVMTAEEAAIQKLEGVPFFPVTLVHALRIGEETGASRDEETNKSEGAMYAMMKQFATSQIKADKTAKEIKGAAMYPIGLGVVTLVAIGLLMYFAIPRMAEIYKALLPNNSDLPYATQILVSASEFFTSWLGVFTVVATIASFVAFFRWIKTPNGFDWWERKKLRFPIFGQLFRWQYAALLLRNFAMLVDGQPDMRARFREAIKTMPNPVYKEMLEDILYEFDEYSRPLAVLFRPYAWLMGDEFHTVIVTAEKTGNIKKLFSRYARVLEERADRRVELIKHIMSNYLIIPIGVAVGLVVAALYWPLFELAGRMAK